VTTRFEVPPSKAGKTRKGETANPRTSIGFYKNVDDAKSEKDIMALMTEEISEYELLTRYFDSHSPTDIKRIILFTAGKDLGLISESEEDSEESTED
jgi:hypothetical protein